MGFFFFFNIQNKNYKMAVKMKLILGADFRALSLTRSFACFYIMINTITCVTFVRMENGTFHAPASDCGNQKHVNYIYMQNWLGRDEEKEAVMKSTFLFSHLVAVTEKWLCARFCYILCKISATDSMRCITILKKIVALRVSFLNNKHQMKLWI